jgi:hypothetical protein
MARAAREAEDKEIANFPFSELGKLTDTPTREVSRTLFGAAGIAPDVSST